MGAPGGAARRRPTPRSGGYPAAMTGGKAYVQGGQPAAASAPPAAAAAGLADVIGGSLPARSEVVVRWRDPARNDRGSATAGAAASLHDVAGASLDTGLRNADGTLLDRWTSANGTEVAVAAHCPAALAPAARQAWQALVRHVVDASLEAMQAQARIASLQKSERLQQALYEIADLAGSGLEMQEMLGRIHAIVGGLMYAENC